MTNHNPVYYNPNSVQQALIQKHLGIHLHTKVNFQEHLNDVLSKLSKTTGLLHKLQAVLLRQSLVRIYKAFIISYLDYKDIIYDQSYNGSFYQKLE